MLAKISKFNAIAKILTSPGFFGSVKAALALCLPLCCLVSLPVQATQQASTIRWGNDVQVALAQASQTGQPVLLHFYSDNCVPCKMLDAKAFKSPALGESMARSVLPVKINYDQHRDIAKRYQITRFPTDLFLHPNGEEIYRTVSPQDPADYSKLLDRIAIKNRDWVMVRMSQRAPRAFDKESLASTHANDRNGIRPSDSDFASSLNGRPVTTKSELFQPQPSEAFVEPEPNTYCLAPDVAEDSLNSNDERPNRNVFHLASQTSEVRENRYQRDRNPGTLSNEAEPEALADSNGIVSRNSIDGSASASGSHSFGSASASGSQSYPFSSSQKGSMANVTMGGVFADDSTMALDGYCPVSLVTQKAWVPGQTQFSVKHRGRIYQCASEEIRQQFLLDPDRFSPVLSGYDLVHFLATGELIAGKREFGSDYLGRVFVFVNAANKAYFDLHAMQYARNLHTSENADRMANSPSGSAVQR